MSKYEIIQFPDERLKKVAEPVAEVNADIKKIISNMYNTLYSAKNCAALAATQLDIPWSDSIPRRITVIDFSPEKNKPLCLVNPEISEPEGQTLLKEGCMSVAVVTAAVKRHAKIKVKALDEHGQALEFVADGFMAKCIQHELDHLDGKIFIDHLPNYRKAMLIAKVLKRKNK